MRTLVRPFGVFKAQVHANLRQLRIIFFGDWTKYERTAEYSESDAFNIGGWRLPWRTHYVLIVSFSDYSGSEKTTVLYKSPHLSDSQIKEFVNEIQRFREMHINAVKAKLKGLL